MRRRWLALIALPLIPLVAGFRLARVADGEAQDDRVVWQEWPAVLV